MLQNWGKNEKSIRAARTYVYLILGFFAPSVRKFQTKLSLACAEFTFARVELSPVCFTDLICVELTQVRVSSKF